MENQMFSRILLGDEAYSNLVVETGDLDGNGSLDIVIGNKMIVLGPINVYLNDGLSFEQKHQRLELPGQVSSNYYYARHITLGDLDNDADLDILVSPGLYAFYNNGQGQFGVGFDLGSSTNVSSASNNALGDIDGDEDLDIVVVGVNKQGVVLVNNGRASFTVASMFGYNIDARADIELGDLNRDGNIDIVIGNEFSYSSIYFNSGSGSFDSNLNPCNRAGLVFCFGVTGDGVKSIDIGDVNGDNYMDILLGSEGLDRVYFGNNQGELVGEATLRPVADKTTDVALGDVNFDGALDVIVANFGTESYVAINNGNGQYTNFYYIDGAGFYSSSIALGDINSDGFIDIVLGRYEQQSVILLNNGLVEFTKTREIGVSGGRTKTLATGDFNGDGKLDIVAGNEGQANRIFLNTDGESFNDAHIFGTGIDRTTAIGIGDFNNDGHDDIVTGNQGEQSAIYLNDGLGNFYYGSTICDTRRRILCFGDGSTAVQSLAIHDINGDGSQDVVLGGLTEILIYTNSFGSRLALLQSISLPGHLTGKVVMAQYDNSGGVDIFVGTELGIQVYCQNTALLFARCAQVGGLYTSPIFAVADIDEDHLNEIIVKNENNLLVLEVESGIPILGPIELYSELDSVSVSDQNNDGRLDIVVAVQGDKSSTVVIAYYSEMGGGFSEVDVGLVPASIASDIVVLDVDGSGNIDIVIGFYGFPEILFKNLGAGNYSDYIELQQKDLINDAAVGDINGDSYLDIVTNNGYAYLGDIKGDFSRLTRVVPPNYEGMLECIDVADMDNDGSLDVVSKNYIIYNDGRGYFQDGTEIWEGNYADCYFKVANIDGDDDLDIVTPNRVLFNNGYRSYSSVPNPYVTTSSIVWMETSDIDDDGDADMVISYFSEPGRVFFNDGTGRYDRQQIIGGHADRIGKFKVVDFDQDGDHEILSVAANNLIVYEFNNRELELSQEFYIPKGIISGLEIVDLNLDSYLDFLTVDSSGIVHTYVNDRHGNLANFGVFGIPHRSRYSFGDVDLGDFDRDGDIDLFVVGADIANIFFNGFVADVNLTANWPRVNILPPKSDGNAEYKAGNLIPISYLLIDIESERVRRIRASFSLDGGGTWRPVIATLGTVQTNLSASPTGDEHIYIWDTFASGFFGQSDQVIFRIEAIPDVRPARNSIAGNYQRPYVVAATMPFRVRGTQVRVVDTVGQPVAGAMVYRLPGGQSSGAAPLADSAGRPFRTDAQGYLAGRSVLRVGEGGDQLVALRPKTVTDNYTLYHTSAPVSERGLSLTTMTEPGVQTLTVSAERPLLLFNLDVALEWDARGDPQFLARLRDDLRRTSAILYDWSDGQVALGDVTLFHDARRRLYDDWDLWSYANVRLYATNRLRPNANKGGIVSEPTADPTVAGVEYLPGQIRIGAVWNRYGEASGTLGEDWPRTLAHELGHYLFALDENYLGLKNGLLVPITDKVCRSAMADPYRDDFSEFHPDAGWAADCDGTLSQQVNGRSDWESILAFYPDAGLRAPAALDANRGPGLLPLAVTTITESPVPTTTRTLNSSTETPTATRTLDVPLFSLEAGGRALQPGPDARAFLFRDRDKTTIDDGDTIIDLGRPVLDRVEARGAEPGDRLCVFEPEASRLGCEELRVGDQTLSLATNPSWKPEISLTPVTSRTLTVEVANAEPGLTLSARLFPIDLPAGSPVTLSYNDGVYRGVFDSAMLMEPVFEGLLQIQVQDGSGREAVVDFALAGNPGHRWARTAPRGSPGHRWARTAPRGTPGHRWARTAPVISSDGMAILYTDQEFAEGEFYSLQSVGTLPNTPAWATPVGEAYRLTATANAPALDKASISFSYLQRDVPAGQEGGLTVYHYNGTTWTALHPARSEAVNIVSAPLNGPGIYALMTSIEVELRNGPGWNYIRYPGRGGAANGTEQPVSEALSGLLRQPELASRLLVYHDNGLGATPRWRLFAAGAPPYVNTLTHMTFDEDYYLWVPHQTDWPVQGSAVTAAALPQPPATFYGTVHSDGEFSATAGMLVTARAGATVCGQGTTQVIEGQVVYVVAVEAEGTQTGCGVVGRQVSFQVGDRLLSGSSTWDDSRVQPVDLRPGLGLVGQRVYLPLVQQ